MEYQNPAGTDGFDFLEFATNDVSKLTKQFTAMGLKPIAKHKRHDVTIFQENGVRFFINNAKNTQASHFASKHGASACAMGFKVKDAKAAYEYCINHGARPYTESNETDVYSMPAICGVGGSVIYFVEYKDGKPNYAHEFDYQDEHAEQIKGLGLTYIDHVTHNLNRGNMDVWADFYTRLFNFREVRYFDIEGKLTGLKAAPWQALAAKFVFH